MSIQSFLDKELKLIDQGVSQKQRQFVFNEFSLVDLLAFSATEEVFFYESKEEDFTFLGLGKSLILEPSITQKHLNDHPEDVLVYQGLFESGSMPLTYLPEWCFLKKDNKVTLRIYDSLEYRSPSPSNIIFNHNVWESFVGPWVSYEEKPESDEWKKMIEEADKLFNQKILDKIVLSRKKIFSYDELIEKLVMFRELYEANKGSSHFSIYHQFNYNEAFISFTPERLFTLKGKTLETISLAGSIKRGLDESEDLSLEEELRGSDKLIREHGIVTEAIEKKLNPIMWNLSISPLHTMKLPYIQHRQATIKGVLKDDTDTLALIDLLHPTPAVGGIPHEEAKTKILEIEKDRRDYYAAPVGVLGHDFSELAVGIRSGLIVGNEITVFGGAGIVHGSTSEDEWIETGVKMHPFIKVINKSTI